MKYGKIHIEDGMIFYSSHMITNTIPCKDIIWAYHFRENAKASSADRSLVSNYLVVLTNRGRSYQFSMSEREAGECLKALQMLQPDMAFGYPCGSRIDLQNLSNTRDLGALETKEGKHILPCRLIRSGELYHVSATDRLTLERNYHVRTIIDLRSNKERRKKPDDILSNVEYHHIPLLEEGSKSVFLDTGLMDMISSMEHSPQEIIRSEYEKFIRDPYTVGQLALVLEVIRKADKGAVLWHCTLGKDRTDLVTMILLSILGVEKEIIREDFMRSNLYLGLEKNYQLQLAEMRGFERRIVERRICSLYEVRVVYMDALFKAIDQVYQGMDNFLHKALYLNSRALDDFREKFLV
ncbi:MAG: tyrosine-protein phosphatase [Blautia sp.]|nr:tyrosine-protein phosphatase [Blautia sp.]